MLFKFVGSKLLISNVEWTEDSLRMIVLLSAQCLKVCKNVIALSLSNFTRYIVPRGLNFAVSQSLWVQEFHPRPNVFYPSLNQPVFVMIMEALTSFLPSSRPESACQLIMNTNFHNFIFLSENWTRETKDLGLESFCTGCDMANKLCVEN